MTITRKKNKNGVGYGWWVRVDFSKDHKPEYTANFNDVDYGGKPLSHKEAKKCEERFLSESGYIPSKEPPQVFKPNKNTSNSTGIAGVTHYICERSGYIQEKYVASWQEGCSCGKRKQKTKEFSVKKYGKRKAFQLAIKTRNDNLEIE